MNGKQQELHPIEAKILFEEKMYVELPAGTSDMPSDMVMQLYPYEKRPQLIYLQEENSLYFTFSLLDKGLEAGQVSQAIYASLQVIEEAYPGSVIDQISMVQNASGGMCGWFGFQPPTLGQARYNMMYVTSVDHRFMHGTCSALLEDKAGLSAIKQVPLTIKTIRREERNVRPSLHR